MNLHFRSKLITSSLQRPVNWLIWSFESDTAMIVVPEAELLIPIFQNSPRAGTHLLTYAAPVNKRMLHFNKLNYYSIPPLPDNWKPPAWLTIELGIIAGRVYFDFDEYEELSNYLGIVDESGRLVDAIDESKTAITPSSSTINDATHERDDGGFQRNKRFTENPPAFLMEWLTIRRKGQEFTNTPMSYACHGKPMNEDRFFFSKTDRGKTALRKNSAQGSQA